MIMWHHCTDNNRDENPNDDQNTVYSRKHGQRPVQIENHKAADPGANDIRQEYMPPLRCKFWMKCLVHGDRLSSDDLGRAGQT